MANENVNGENVMAENSTQQVSEGKVPTVRIRWEGFEDPSHDTLGFPVPRFYVSAFAGMVASSKEPLLLLPEEDLAGAGYKFSPADSKGAFELLGRVKTTVEIKKTLREWWTSVVNNEGKNKNNVFLAYDDENDAWYRGSAVLSENANGKENCVSANIVNPALLEAKNRFPVRSAGIKDDGDDSVEEDENENMGEFIDDYDSFVSNKVTASLSSNGKPIDVAEEDFHPILFDWQKLSIAWALKRGSCALFQDCGMGKTLQQLEWARHIPGRVLFLCPLSVVNQTIKEAEKLDMTLCNGRLSGDISKAEYVIINYDSLHKISPAGFSGVVLDESSIIKQYHGKFRTAVTKFVADIPYRLCCSATPSPNDHEELGSHAEFLGICPKTHMLSKYFMRDNKNNNKWRMKRHAVNDFWRWVSTWALTARTPKDIIPDVDMKKYELPQFIQKVVDARPKKEQESSTGKKKGKKKKKKVGFRERHIVYKASFPDRLEKIKELVASMPDQPIVIWVEYNAESEAITNAIEDAVELTGSQKPEKKVEILDKFVDGRVRVLVTKPHIAAFGVNWQHCHSMIFCSLSYSFEKYYQSARRCWRFGQKNEVTAYLVTSTHDEDVLATLKRKQQQCDELYGGAVAQAMQAALGRQGKLKSMASAAECFYGNGWEMRQGDCMEQLALMETDSVDMSVFSPPFAELYVYSDDPRDMSNCADMEEFLEHFKYFAEQMYRVTKPGRICVFHCMDLPITKARYGYIGLRDLSGSILRLFERAGFIYHSRHLVNKDPLVEMIRTKAHGLMHKMLVKDSSMCRAGLGDHVIAMRKPGDIEAPIVKPLGFTRFIGRPEDEPARDPENPEAFSHHVWRNYATPIWNIRLHRTLHKKVKGKDDEKHLTPLQLDVSERCIDLWSNLGDTILSPFAGIGSEGVSAIRLGRKFLGIELKKEYCAVATKNLEDAAREPKGEHFVAPPRDPYEPKPPKTAETFYVESIKEDIKEANPEMTGGERIELYNAMWVELSDEEREPYLEMYAKDRERFLQEKKEFEQKKKDRKRPKSAFARYQEEVKEAVRNKNPDMSHPEILGILRKNWEGMTEKQKRPFQEMFEKDAERYEEAMEEFYKTDEGAAFKKAKEAKLSAATKKKARAKEAAKPKEARKPRKAKNPKKAKKTKKAAKESAGESPMEEENESKRKNKASSGKKKNITDFFGDAADSDEYVPSTSTSKRKRGKDASAPKPREKKTRKGKKVTGYKMFTQTMRESIKNELEFMDVYELQEELMLDEVPKKLSAAHVMKALGQRWRMMSPDEKAFYASMATAEE